MFKILSICRGGGYKYCKTSPQHPRANSSGLYPLHRVLMENKLGRLLTKNEVVHHKDNDKENNIIDNLEVLTKSQHAKKHSKEIKRVKCFCGQCLSVFYIKPFEYRLRLKRNKYKKIFCSTSCGAVHQQEIAKPNIHLTK